MRLLASCKASKSFVFLGRFEKKNKIKYRYPAKRLDKNRQVQDLRFYFTFFSFSFSWTLHSNFYIFFWDLLLLFLCSGTKSDALRTTALDHHDIGPDLLAVGVDALHAKGVRGLDINQPSVLEPLLGLLALEPVVVGHELESLTLGVRELDWVVVTAGAVAGLLLVVVVVVAVGVGGGLSLSAWALVFLYVFMGTLSMSMSMSVTMTVSMVMMVVMEVLTTGLVLKVNNDQPSVLLQQLAAQGLDRALDVVNMVQDKVGEDQIESLALGDVFGGLGLWQGGLGGDEVVDGRDLGLEVRELGLGGELLVQALEHPFGGVDADHVVDGGSDGLTAQS